MTEKAVTLFEIFDKLYFIMTPNFINLLNLVGSILSIISFFPIMGATISWFWKRTKQTITLQDKNGKSFTVKVRRKYLNNRDLTPLIQLKYGGDVDIAKNVRLSILKATLNADKHIQHLGPEEIDTIVVS